MSIKIYTLGHPITGEVRHVGKTKSTLNDRLSKHVHDGKYKKRSNHIVNWVGILLDNGLRPKIELIEEVANDNWRFWELYWQYQFRTWGYNLCNHDYSIKEPIDGWKMPKDAIKKRLETIKTSKRWKKCGEDHSRYMKQLYKDKRFINPRSSMTKEQIKEVHRKSVETNMRRNVEQPERKLRHRVVANMRAVIATDLKTKEEKEFESVSMAAKELHTSIERITMVCKGIRVQTKGYKFHYKDIELRSLFTSKTFPKKGIKLSGKRKVAMYNNEGKELMQFESCRQAAVYIGNEKLRSSLRQVATKENNLHGYQWKFVQVL